MKRHETPIIKYKNPQACDTKEAQIEWPRILKKMCLKEAT